LGTTSQRCWDRLGENGLVIIAIDGVDGVGKTTLANALEADGFAAISANLYRPLPLPIQVRHWSDIPIMGVARKFGGDIVLDRSIVSVLAYNYGQVYDNSIEVFNALIPFFSWYSEGVEFFFLKVDAPEQIWKRAKTFDSNFGDWVRDDQLFRDIYGIIGASVTVLNASDSTETNVKKIKDKTNVHFLGS